MLKRITNWLREAFELTSESSPQTTSDQPLLPFGGVTACTACRGTRFTDRFCAGQVTDVGYDISVPFCRVGTVKHIHKTCANCGADYTTEIASDTRAVPPEPRTWKRSERDSPGS